MFPSGLKARKSSIPKHDLKKVNDSNSHARQYFRAAHLSRDCSNRRRDIDQPLVALVGRALDDSRSWHSLCVERICHTARKRIWVETGADLFRFYPRSGHVCGLAASRWKTSRPVWSFLDICVGKHSSY